ncbi:MAG: DUF4232 domain-containing protein [Streptosporangiales bacterium]|nr:DUF4232 domain-containing protein [Streptosporangiales bacterium]
MALQRPAPARRAAAIGGIGVLAAFLAITTAACGATTPGGGSPVGADQGTSTSPSGEAAGAPGASPSDGGGNSGGGNSGGGNSGGGSLGGDGSGDDIQRCRSEQLEAKLGREGAAAGNRYAPLVFTNTGEDPCGLLGYPGVTVLNSDKEQIGPDADRAPGNPVERISLAPGESASAQLHWASEVAGDCRTTSSYLRTYPPDETKALVIPARIQLCGDVFDVRSVTGGRDGVAG